MPALRLLLTFAIVFSLVSLPSVSSSHFSLPNIGTVKAQQETAYGSWYPAGAQEQTLSISEGNPVQPTEFTWITGSQIDAMGSPLTAGQLSQCQSSASMLCSAPVADKGYFEIQFELSNVLWGIPMAYGNNPAGVQLRQGIAHLINKAAFVAGNPACAGVVCIPNDDPLPPCYAASCPNGGLVNPNPCGWDTIFPESSSTNCTVGAPGGTAYNCAYSTACPTGTITGTTQYAGQVAIGSPDFCAAAQHFVDAFKIQLGINVTQNSHCELVPPSGGWPGGVLALPPNCNSLTPTADVCFFVRTTEPRKSLGEGLAQEICALFSPAWTGGTGWTTLAGQPVSCDSTNTGSANAACGGGTCPFLQVTEGDLTNFCGFTTSVTGVPNNCWGIGTFGFGEVFPFDTTLYYEYSGSFTTQTTVTCPNANCTFPTPGSPCTANALTSGASNYMYVCSPTYDQLSSAMEFSTCLASPGPSADPTINQAAPSFANCSGGTVSGGAGATTCIGLTPSCSAVSAGYQAADFFGENVLTLPIYSPEDYYARLNNWLLGGSTPGFSTAVGFRFQGLPNYFNWLNAYSATPAVAGTLRQSFPTTVDSLNPFDAATVYDFYVLSEIYDSLFQPNPLCSIATTPGLTSCSQPYQLIDWMTTSHNFLCYPGGLTCSSTTLGYGNATYFSNTVADLRLTLNRSNHWQDGGPVTAWDVKYSFMNLNATGAFQASSLSNISHINVLDEYTLDLNLKAVGPFTVPFIGEVTIIPGHIWSACGASTWNTGVTGSNLVNGVIRNAAEDTCVGVYGAPSIVTVGGIRADSPTFSLMQNNFVIGSGPYECQSIGGTGHPAVGTVGGGCSVDNIDTPALGLGVYTLTRNGCTLTSLGTTCGAAGASSDYFHSSGALAKYVWTGDVGSGSADFSKVLMVNSCHSSTPSANCPHWEEGIGNPGGTGSNPVGLSQRLAVNSFKGISWIDFSTPQSAGTGLILTCAPGYTLPRTTITPCNTASAGWTPNVMPGIGSFAGTLYEVGSNILSTSTSTLSPASIVGCSTAYPNGGYDC